MVITNVCYLQSYVDFDPSFVNNHEAEITKTWTILNNQGIHHELSLTKFQIIHS